MHKKTLADLPIIVGLLPNDELVRYDTIGDGPYKVYIAYCKMGCSCGSGARPSKADALKSLRESHKRLIDRLRKCEPERESFAWTRPNVPAGLLRPARGYPRLSGVYGSSPPGFTLASAISETPDGRPNPTT